MRRGQGSLRPSIAERYLRNIALLRWRLRIWMPEETGVTRHSVFPLRTEPGATLLIAYGNEVSQLNVTIDAQRA